MLTAMQWYIIFPMIVIGCINGNDYMLPIPTGDIASGTGVELLDYCPYCGEQLPMGEGIDTDKRVTKILHKNQTKLDVTI